MIITENILKCKDMVIQKRRKTLNNFRLKNYLPKKLLVPLVPTVLNVPAQNFRDIRDDRDNWDK
jgi:hypothetical protein